MKCGEALEELDRDVAQDRVADHHVGHVVDEVAALDVAGEVEVRLVEQLGRALDPGVALALLLADREQRHAWTFDAQDPLREQGAHVRVLVEVLGRRVGVGADVEEDERPRFGDHLDGQRGPVHARQAAEPENRGSHARAGVAGRHDRVRVAALDEIHGHEDRRVALLAEGLGRVLVHADHLAGRLNPDVRDRVGARDRSDQVAVPDENGLVGRVRPRVFERAVDQLGRTVVAAHRVDRDANPTLALGLADGAQVHVSAVHTRAPVRQPDATRISRWSRPRTSSARSPGGRCSSRSSGRRCEPA